MEFLASLHPELVHFPIALLLTYCFLEIIGVIIKKESFTKAASIILVLGLIGAVAAVLTGNQADEVAEILFDKDVNIPLGKISAHETYATYTLWYFMALFFLRIFLILKKKFTGKIKYIFILLALIGGTLVFLTGLKGGELVYKYGVGTEVILPPESSNTK